MVGHQGDGNAQKLNTPLRVFNFPSGPHNFGRLLYLAQKHASVRDNLSNTAERRALL